MLRLGFLVLLSLSFLPACQENKVIAVKDFRIYPNTDNAELQEAIKVLAVRYNKDLGSNALTIVDQPEDGNSVISFRSGLHNDEQKLGLGQWTTTSSHKTSLTIEGEKNTETVRYAMNIEFDEENFEAKVPMLVNSTSDAANHLYHLFCHEIGHGVQMGHSRESSSVMYPSIPEKSTRYIDYRTYFNQVRSFLGSR